MQSIWVFPWESPRNSVYRKCHSGQSRTRLAVSTEWVLFQTNKSCLCKTFSPLIVLYGSPYDDIIYDADLPNLSFWLFLALQCCVSLLKWLICCLLLFHLCRGVGLFCKVLFYTMGVVVRMWHCCTLARIGVTTLYLSVKIWVMGLCTHLPAPPIFQE